MTPLHWLGLAAVGAIASVGFLLRLRFRIRYRPTRKRGGDGWQRGRLALLGLVVSLLVTGTGAGGALFPFLQPTVVANPPDPELLGWSTPDSALERTRGVRRDTIASTDTALFLRPPNRVAANRRPDSGTSSPGAVGPRATDRSLDTVAPGEIAPSRDTTGPAASPQPADPSVSPDTARPPDPDGPPAATPAATPSPSAPPAPATSGTGRWAVQVGVFGVRDNARALMGRLEESGIQGFVVPRTGSGDRTLSYVYAGRYALRDSADAGARRVRAAGMDAVVVEFRPPSP